MIHPLLHRFFGGSHDDLHRMEHDLHAADDVDWTVFRPPQLTDGAPNGRYRTALDARLPGARRSARTDLAATMIGSLDDPTLVGHIVTIAADIGVSRVRVGGERATLKGSTSVARLCRGTAVGATCCAAARPRP